MNKAIVRLFGVVILLFGVLVVFTSRWTIFDANALQKQPLNRLAVYASWKVKRGRILADNGTTVLAKSVHGSGGIWGRTYPHGSLFSQAIGYSNEQQEESAGMERYFAPQLVGVKSSLATIFGTLNGGTQTGDDVYSTLNPKGQQLARQLLAGRTGSVVAIVPQTGAVKVMYSNPTYDDNDPGKYGSSFNECAPNPFDNGCLVNLAVAGRFPPGSTFKIVTTTAALGSGKYTPQSLVSGPSPLQVSGRPLQNDGNTSYGPTPLTTALTYSINTIYAQVGQSLGAKVMQEYMQRFGFYSTPPLQYPADEMSPSGELMLGKNGYSMLPPTHPCTTAANCVDLGRMSIGQDKLGVTPLQMAMVVSAIANDGTLMQPRLATKVVNQDGQVVQRYPATVYDQVMKPKIAREIQQMMRSVVEEGTGQSANLEGLPIAGKTGTASTYTKDGVSYDDAWFIGFPVHDPKIAVAVMLQNIKEGYGGTYAAPIAAKMIQALLAEGQ